MRNLLTNLWTKLTGNHAYRLSDRDSYRAYFNLTERDSYGPSLHVELPYQVRPRLGASVSIDTDENKISFFASCGVTAYLSLDDIFPRAWLASLRGIVRHGSQYGTARKVGWQFYWEPDAEGMVLWIELWKEKFSTAHDDNKKWPWQGNGWNFYWNLNNALLGRYKRFTGEETETKQAFLEMPEGRYPAVVKMHQVRWARPAWLALEKRFPQLEPEWQWVAEVEIPGGIPTPGKGENSYDCGDDAVFSVSVGASDEKPRLSKVLQDTAQRAMRNRFNYGDGYEYKPSAGWPPHCQIRP